MIEPPITNVLPEVPPQERYHADSAKEQRVADIVRRRRRMRWARFIAGETIALAILVLSVVAGISERFAAETLTPIFRAVPITAAAIAAILPILFFGDPKRRSRFK
jgi:hypothetical protein